MDEAQDFSANMIRAMFGHLAPDHSVTLCSTPHNVIPSVATPIRATSEVGTDTSNKPFSAWGEIFGDDMAATAIIDRLMHHARSSL